MCASATGCTLRPILSSARAHKVARGAIQIVAAVPILNVLNSRVRMRELHTVVLASVSPRRRELLSSLGLRVLVVPSDVEEGDRPGYGPLELARLHAAAKAEAVARRKPGELTVAADTVVDL